MSEVWRDIPKFEGLYQISSLGRVKSCERNVRYLLKYRKVSEVIMSLKEGESVRLRKNGGRKRFKVDSLMELAGFV